MLTLLEFPPQHTTALLAAPQIATLLQNHNIPVNEAFSPLETMATWCGLQIDVEKLGQMKTTPEELCKRTGDIAFNDKSTMLTNRIRFIVPSQSFFKRNIAFAGMVSTVTTAIFANAQ